MATNPWTSSGGNLTGLARDIVPVTPDDDNDIIAGSVAIAITCKTTAGNVVIITADGNERTYPIKLDEVLSVGVARVKATNTTAVGIWAYMV